MNKEAKKRWVEALRSGEYKQGMSLLCQPDNVGKDKFCCLGVLADIEYDGDWEFCDHSKYWRIDGHGGYLPYSFREEIGLTVDQTRDLALKNDAGYSFEEIADFIEENL